MSGMKASHQIRVLTCCYCGARSTLPRDASRALVCHGCGAPIRRIEKIQPELERMARGATSGRPAHPHPADRHDGHRPQDRPARRRKGKYKKSGFWDRLRRIADDADDIFDIFDFD